MSLFDLTGMVAVITGSSKGIGKASALELAEHGAKVVISSRKQDACDTVAAEINARYGEGSAIAVAANISDKAALQHLVDETRALFGRIDILVCNAASNPYYGPQAGISDDQFRKILDNNIVSNHWLISMVVPEMRDRKDGAIIIISSIGGLRGSTAIGAYCISKAADMQLARNLAHEYGPDNVRVNCIAPGYVYTPMVFSGGMTPELRDARRKNTLLQTEGTGWDIGNGVVYLASEQARWVSGIILSIDAGSMAGTVGNTTPVKAFD